MSAPALPPLLSLSASELSASAVGSFPFGAAAPGLSGAESGTLESIALVLAQEQAPARPNGTQALFSTLALWGPIILIFYFIWIRPSLREAKTREEMFTNMKRNDEVVTIGGLVGVISSIPSDGKEVLIKVDGTRLRVRRDAIREVVPKSSKGDKGDADGDSRD